MSNYKIQLRDGVTGSLLAECKTEEEAVNKLVEPKFKNAIAWVMEPLTNRVSAIIKLLNLAGYCCKYDDAATIEQMVKR